MKISKSKQELARIISENGGWREGNYAVQDKDDKKVWFMFQAVGKPSGRKCWPGVKSRGILCDKVLPHWHQTILSRDEYFHLYPAQDADGWIEWKGGECPVGHWVRGDFKIRNGEVHSDLSLSMWNWQHGVFADAGREIVAYRLRKQERPHGIEPTSPFAPEPTIEQLAAEYRNRQDYAERKQKEADEAMAEAEAKLKELYQAGIDIGLDIAIASDETDTDPSPELVITDWRDLQVGDEVEGRHYDRMVIGAVCEIDEECRDDRPFRIHEEGGSPWWVTSKEFKFIRRP